MIAKAAPRRRTGAGSFSDLQAYLERDETGAIREDCLATWSHGVASHETSALEMQAVVNRSRYRGADPVYHLVASWRPGEIIDVDTAKQTERALIQSLGATGHQSFSALHYDDKLDRYHLHVGVNRVNATTGKALNTWQDYARLARATEWCEREYGLQVDRRVDWRKRVGERDFALEDLGDRAAGDRTAADNGVLPQATPQALESRARTHYSWAEIMRSEVSPAVAAALDKPTSQWVDMHAALRPYGVRFEVSGSGFRIVGPEHGQHVKASEIGIDATQLRQRLGEFQAPLDTLTFDSRVVLAKSAATSWRSWADVHRDLESAELGIRNAGGGRGQIVDLVGDRTTPLARMGVTMAKLEERFGPYEMGAAMKERLAREQTRRDDGLNARAAAIAEDPSLVLTPLSTMQSTWERHHVERAVRTKLGLKTDEYAGDVDAATDAVLAACTALDADRKIFTTLELQVEERALFQAAKALHAGTGAPRLRAPGRDLDDQQRLAYEHLASERQLAIVTGVAGAGKSRLQRDLCAAYTEAGARVIGVAVAGAAARTLGDEAQIESRTVAKFLVDLENGREKLAERDVVFVDEAGTIGSDQGRRLLEHVREAGASVRLLGDEAQHESVTRGAVLRGLVEDVGAFDMRSTRRAKHKWLRDVARDLRDGKVAPALDALREHGAIRAYATQEEAREALVTEFVAIHGQTIDDDGTARPRAALLLADSNADMNAMNATVQERLLDAGRLGDVANYTTILGEKPMAIGDVVAIREAMDSRNSSSRWVNGDRGTILEHLSDGVMRIRRDRDGVVDIWDTNERAGIQLGYAMTSYRSQGSTVDDVFVLPADGRRGTYVDITRARESVRIAYGEDRVRDFGDLMFRAQKENGKTLIRDVERSAAEISKKHDRRVERDRDAAIDRGGRGR